MSISSEVSRKPLNLNGSALMISLLVQNRPMPIFGKYFTTLKKKQNVGRGLSLDTIKKYCKSWGKYDYLTLEKKITKYYLILT